MQNFVIRNLLVVVARSVGEVDDNAKITATMPSLIQQHLWSEPQMMRHLTT